MSNFDIDHQAIAELRAMARVYIQHGKADEAASVLKLASEIESRLHETRYVAGVENGTKLRAKEPS